MYDDEFDDDTRAGRRGKERRRPTGATRRDDLVREEQANGAGQEGGPFDDHGLNYLHRKGYLLDLGEQVRSGKEATVYRARGPEGPLAAKVYSDLEVRGFQTQDTYTAGRYIADRRVRRLLGSANRRGLDPDLAHWVHHEYRTLWQLHRAGVRVPAPAVGPDPVEMVNAGRVVLMEWVGDEEPAPRLSDTILTEEQLQDAWRQSLEMVTRLLELGVVHGDFSAYNLLWWQEQVVLIDVPQAVDVDSHPNAGDLFDRDIGSLCSSFRSLGIDENPQLLAMELRAQAGYPPSGPLSR